jgi:hypothetical protein
MGQLKIVIWRDFAKKTLTIRTPLEHCFLSWIFAPSTPEVGLPDPARGPGNPATPRPFHLTVVEYFTVEHGCMDAGATLERTAPAQPSPGSKPFCLSGRSKQKLDAGSPGQLANLAV